MKLYFIITCVLFYLSMTNTLGNLTDLALIHSNNFIQLALKRPTSQSILQLAELGYKRIPFWMRSILRVTYKYHFLCWAILFVSSKVAGITPFLLVLVWQKSFYHVWDIFHHHFFFFWLFTIHNDLLGILLLTSRTLTGTRSPSKERS